MKKKRAQPRKRLVNVGNQADVVVIGLPPRMIGDYYYRFLMARWSHVLLTLVIAYVLLNVIFALLYLAGEHAIENADPNSFRDAFFFSVQTMATIGYGQMSPGSLYANILVATEAFVGMVFVAMATGLMFSKFSRPTARVRFTDKILITKHDGKRVLMLRMANARANHVAEAKLRLTFSTVRKTEEGTTFRRMLDLQLTRDNSPMFVLTWTAMHVIDKESPLYGLTAEELVETRTQIIASFNGLDETFGQTIYARRVYDTDHIEWNGRFADIFQNQSSNGLAAVVDMRHFDSIL